MATNASLQNAAKGVKDTNMKYIHVEKGMIGFAKVSCLKELLSDRQMFSCFISNLCSRRYMVATRGGGHSHT